MDISDGEIRRYVARRPKTAVDVGVSIFSAIRTTQQAVNDAPVDSPQREKLAQTWAGLVRAAAIMEPGLALVYAQAGAKRWALQKVAAPLIEELKGSRAANALKAGNGRPAAGFKAQPD